MNNLQILPKIPLGLSQDLPIKDLRSRIYGVKALFRSVFIIVSTLLLNQCSVVNRSKRPEFNNASTKNRQTESENTDSNQENIELEKNASGSEVSMEEETVIELPSNITGAFLHCVKDELDIKDFWAEFSCSLLSKDRSRVSPKFENWRVAPNEEKRFSITTPKNAEWDILFTYQGENLEQMKSDFNATKISTDASQQTYEVELKAFVTEGLFQQEQEQEKTKGEITPQSNEEETIKKESKDCLSEGDVECPPQATGLSANLVNNNQIEISWDDMGGSYEFLLTMREKSQTELKPTHGTSYEIGLQSGDEIIYIGSETSFKHDGVDKSTTYHYALYTFDESKNYAPVARATAKTYTECGAEGDSCYENNEAMTLGIATTPSGKALEYVFANGSDGFKIWKEQGGDRILRANGLDEWALELNSSGKGFINTEFTNHKVGTDTTIIAGRVCPPNVYIDDSNKFTTGNCLYYSPTFREAPGHNPTAHEWFRTNFSTCSEKQMRAPVLYETTATGITQFYEDLLGGAPVYAGDKGVPSGGGQAWSATSYGQNWFQYWWWNGSSSDISTTAEEKNMICVLP